MKQNQELPPGWGRDSFQDNPWKNTPQKQPVQQPEITQRHEKTVQDHPQNPTLHNEPVSQTEKPVNHETPVPEKPITETIIPAVQNWAEKAKSGISAIKQEIPKPEIKPEPKTQSKSQPKAKPADPKPFRENIQTPPAAKPAVFNYSDFDSELPPILNNPYDNPTDDNKASVSPLIFIIPVIAAILAFLVGFLLMRAKGKTQNTAEVNTQQMTVFSRMPVYAGARTALTRTYFGGVTRILVPDNLKTGVTANTRYETQLNQSYQELAEYYGTAIVPARVRKPQDKGLVEKSVGFSTTWITAALREHRFFSFSEVKEAVAERLEFINTKPFQKRPGCRREAYLSEEKEFMLPLPKRPYEPAVWKQQTVGNDYLISDGLNKYSVPFDLIGEQVQIRLTRDLVEVYFKGSRMTSHKRLEKYSVQPVVKPEHMPDRHREYLSYNADEFREWAKTVGKPSLLRFHRKALTLLL